MLKKKADKATNVKPKKVDVESQMIGSVNYSTCSGVTKAAITLRSGDIVSGVCDKAMDLGTAQAKALEDAKMNAEILLS